MKSTIAASLLVLASMSAMAITPTERDEAFRAVTRIEPVSGVEFSEMKREMAVASEADIKAQLVDTIYRRDVKVDNPNAMDRADLRKSLESKSIAQLVKMAG